MRILMIAPLPFFTDSKESVRVLEEALGLEKLGHEVVIATGHLGLDVQREIKTQLQIRRTGRPVLGGSKVSSWRLFFQVVRLIRQFDPEIIHAHLPQGAAIAWLAQKLFWGKQKKLLVDFYDTFSPQYARQGKFRKLKIWAGGIGDWALVNSQAGAEKIREIRGDNKVEIIANGANFEHYLGLPVKEAQRRDLELPLDKTIVIYAGALQESKGLQHFLEAVLLVLQKTQNVYFIVAGSPAEGVERFVAENNIQNNVRLISPLSYFDLPKILNAADIAIDPREAGNCEESEKVPQYMAAGLPIVCFARGNNCEYLGEGAVYCPEVSARNLAENILRFLMNPLEIRERGKINSQRVVAYSWTRSVEKIDRIYREMFLNQA